MFEMDKLDPKALAQDVAKLIEEQIGAKVNVSLQKFERSNPGYTNDRVSIGFSVTEDWTANMVAKRYGRSDNLAEGEQPSAEGETNSII